MKFLRAGVCALLLFAVAVHGGVEDWAAAVLEAGAATLLVFWAIRVAFGLEKEIHGHPLLWPLGAFAGVTVLQFVLRTSVYPYAGKVDFLKLLAYLIVVFLAAQAYRTLDHLRGFVWFVLVLGFAVSVFGILQHLTFNGKLYWVREMRYGGVPFGPFANRNHFAGLVELLTPPGLAALAMGKVRRDQWLLVGLFSLFPIAGLFLSASRGGIISFLVEMVLLLLLIWLRRNERKQLAAAAAVLVVAGALVTWLGVERTLQRFSSYQTLEVHEDKRISMARDSWRIFLDHPLLGTGLGTLQSVFPEYETLYDGKVVNHAHNDYLEALAETGLAGGACCAWFLAVLAIYGIRNIRNNNSKLLAALQMGALVSCGGLLTHSAVDFNLHIPSNTLFFLLLAGFAVADIRVIRRVTHTKEQPLAHPQLVA
jgi:O-antigen ligase